MGRGQAKVQDRRRNRTTAVGHLERAQRLDEWVRSSPDELVTRAEFVNALEVYHRKQIEGNRWWRVFWRWLHSSKDNPIVRIDLFAALKARRD